MWRQRNKHCHFRWWWVQPRNKKDGVTECDKGCGGWEDQFKLGTDGRLQVVVAFNLRIMWQKGPSCVMTWGVKCIRQRDSWSKGPEAGVSLDVRGQQGAQESWSTKDRGRRAGGCKSERWAGPGSAGEEAEPDFSATSLLVHRIPSYPLVLMQLKQQVKFTFYHFPMVVRFIYLYFYKNNNIVIKTQCKQIR